MRTVCAFRVGRELPEGSATVAPVSVPNWSAYDEGYLRAYEWSSALAGGAAMPQEATTTQLGPGEVAHARFAPVGVSGYFGEQKEYRSSFFLIGGPVGLALARAVETFPLGGARVLELGCGLGLPSFAAAIGGARVLATDWAPDAVALLRENARRNELGLRVEIVDWDEPEPLLREAPWDLVLAADVLYERRNAERLLELLPALCREVLLADPSRPHAQLFLDAAAADWRIETCDDPKRPRVRIHHLISIP